jgi:hypothetical protein
VGKQRCPHILNIKPLLLTCSLLSALEKQMFIACLHFPTRTCLIHSALPNIQSLTFTHTLGPQPFYLNLLLYISL